LSFLIRIQFTSKPHFMRACTLLIWNLIKVWG
jgi:hypothetical protein